VSYGLLSAGSKSEELKRQFDVLFGSVKQGDNDGAAGLIEVGDGDWVHGTGRQGYLDHVAIDRATGFAVKQKLFDEAPLESPAFVTTIGVRFTEAQKANLKLFFYLLRELFEGFVQAGRGTSRGNGEISLVLAEEIELDLANDISYQPPPDAEVVRWYRRRRILLPLAGQWQDIASLAESLTSRGGGVSMSEPLREWKECKLDIELVDLPEKKLIALIQEWQNAYLLQHDDLQIEFTALPAQVTKLRNEGRVFDGEQELRWQRMQDGKLWVIRIREGSSGKDYEYREQRYYLWGEWNESRFVEGRFTAELHYPLQGSEANDRAYIVVREYRQAQPKNWDDFAGKLDELEEILNSPPIAAHRFVAVGVGRDGGGGK
jgi:hypothetical protein